MPASSKPKEERKYKYPSEFINKKTNTIYPSKRKAAAKWVAAQKEKGTIKKKLACAHAEGLTREACNRQGYRSRCGRCCGKKLLGRKKKSSSK